jgi:DinB superfamily
MKDLVLPSYNLTLNYARKLAADVPDEQMTAQPVPGRVMNHPAFVLGHLAWAGDVACWLLGQPPAHADWKELFGMGTTPQADRSLYPSKADLVKALEDAHARVIDALDKAAPDALTQLPPERMRSRFPTVGHALLGLMTSHESTHLGQFSAWRRAMGLPSVF